MIYLIKSTDKNGYKGKELILYPGFTSNLTIAQKYKEFKEERAESSVKYEIIPIYISKDRHFYTGNALRDIETFKYFDNMKYDEISEILGTSVGALKASYHYAVKKIEEYLTKSI